MATEAGHANKHLSEASAEFTRPLVYDGTAIALKAIDCERVQLIGGISADTTVTLPASSTCYGRTLKLMVNGYIPGSALDVIMTADLIVKTNGTEFLSGWMWKNAGGTMTIVNCAANTNTLIIELPKPGSTLTLQCDGLRWYVEGMAVTAEAATLSNV